jgi:hypothetical protein
MLAFGAGDVSSNLTGATIYHFRSSKMSVRCHIEIETKSAEQAEAMVRSIELDNGPYAVTRSEGRSIIVDADAKSMSSMLHTLDDLLACLRVAEGATDLK